MTSTSTPTTTEEPGLANGADASPSDLSPGDLSSSGLSPSDAPHTPSASASANLAAPLKPAEGQAPEPQASSTVVIEPTVSWSGVRWGELWHYRELLYFLTWRDIKIRYKQSVLGAAWAIIQPLVTMLIFSFALARVANMSSKTGGIPFSLATYVALVPWTFFAGAVTNSGNSLVGSANLISKVYFPRMIVPAAAVAASVLDFAIAFAFLIPLFIFYRHGPALTPNLLMLPVLSALLLVLALSVGMWMSALNVKYRDIRYALPFLIQVGMFASPVFFWLGWVQEARWRAVMMLNPMTGILEGFRAAIFGLPFNWAALGASALVTAGLAVYSLYVFKRMETSFADII